jgi:hypothetical protein
MVKNGFLKPGIMKKKCIEAKYRRITLGTTLVDQIFCRPVEG